MSHREVDELDGTVAAHHPRERGDDPLRVVRGAVRPRAPAERRVRFLAHEPAVGEGTVDREVRPHPPDPLIHEGPVLLLGAFLEHQVPAVHRILQVAGGREAQIEHLGEPLLTGIATADAEVAPVVVGREVARPVEVDAVDVERRDRLLHDRRRVLALVGAVDADVDVALLLDDRAVDATGRPRRVPFVQSPPNLREVDPSDHPDARLVARDDDGLQARLPRGTRSGCGTAAAWDSSR